MLQGIPFNPILADRYACGVVFRQMVEILKVVDNGKVAVVRDWAELESFGSQLLNVNASLRPSLSMYIRKPLQLVMNR